MTGVRTVSPIDGQVVVVRDYASERDIARVLNRAVEAQASWAACLLAERRRACTTLVDRFVAESEAIARELTVQMGRPVSQAPGEVRGFEERARHMIAIAEEALGPVEPEPKPGFRRFVERAPLGVVLTVAPWNYPYLTAVNSIVPALMAGNSVVLKHSAQTPLCAERLCQAADAAGLPQGLLQFVHCSHEQTARMIQSPEVAFVAFTGSVPGGRAVQEAAASRFIGTGLELGGKDPAYVRADADLAHAAENLVDGAFFNSGQSCCGIERIYVHERAYDEFVERTVALVSAYQLGDPLRAEVNLGPMVRASSADFVREQIGAAVSAGARALIEPSQFPEAERGGTYLAPQVLVAVDHSMRVMTEETFGPVVGIMKVPDDDEAVRLMNDSEFGLTASVWTQDDSAALALGRQVQTGTWFMNRCDYLDPALAWTGVKNSGRGCTLSRLGYEVLTRPKSYHLRV